MVRGSLFYTMAEFKTYAEKLLDARWQKKRLKILERDNWACQHCGDTKKTLHIHHLCYRRDPWSVSDSKLRTLCHECHSQEELYRTRREADILKMLKSRGFDNYNLSSFSVAIEKMDEEVDIRKAIKIIRYIISSREYTEKLFSDYEKRIDELDISDPY